MAATGVRESSPGKNAKGGGFFKKNKALVIGAGGLGAVFLLAHNGSGSSSSGSSGDVTSGELGAYQQGIQDASSLSGLSTGDNSSGSSDGSSSGSSNGSSSGSSGGGSTDVTVEPGGQLNTGGKNTQKNTTNKGGKDKDHDKKTSGHGKKDESHKTHDKDKGAGKTSSTHKGKDTKTKSKEPAHSTKTKSDKDGKTKETGHTDKKGHKKKSPVQVESMDHASSGVTVMGKDFPGATGHTLGPPRRTPGGMVRDVTVHYGGHSETHTMGPNGKSWEMFTRGKNPPMARGTTQLVRGGGNH